MKIKRFLVVAAMFSMLAACGGSGGGASDASKTAAINSFKDFVALIASPEIQNCINLTITDCNCPGGGTVTADLVTGVATFNNCISDSGGVYDGTATINDDLSRASASMTTFDECTNANGDTATGACDGSFSGTCAGGSVECTIIDDPATIGECTLSC